MATLGSPYQSLRKHERPDVTALPCSFVLSASWCFKPYWFLQMSIAGRTKEVTKKHTRMTSGHGCTAGAAQQ